MTEGVEKWWSRIVGQLFFTEESVKMVCNGLNATCPNTTVVKYVCIILWHGIIISKMILKKFVLFLVYV